MVKIKINPQEGFNEIIEEFEMIPGGEYRFENSLKAISNWEAKYKKPFLVEEKRTNQEMIDYYYFMCLDDNFKPEYLTNDVIAILNSYMGDSHTATTFGGQKNTNNPSNFLTSELIYAYMAIAGIPFECDEWEINRLLTTIKCIGILQNPDKDKNKMTKSQLIDHHRALNAKRLAERKARGK